MQLQANGSPRTPSSLSALGRVPHGPPLSMPTSLVPEPVSYTWPRPLRCGITQLILKALRQHCWSPPLSIPSDSVPLILSTGTHPATPCSPTGTRDTGWHLHFRTCRCPPEAHHPTPPPDGRGGCPARSGTTPALGMAVKTSREVLGHECRAGLAASRLLNANELGEY